MKKYIVGGFVRDRLMNIKPKDKDYVLVGCTQNDIQYLMGLGYKQVGKDFPVFLSPQGDEYALARIERKTGVGYNGFDVQTSNVTLVDDLSRRDLTINAIAYDPTKRVHIDPYNGKMDIENKVLRHVSPAFSEDPLRILRLARFAARYPDFKVHTDTHKMVQNMVSSGDIDSLSPDRVYVEFKKAFEEPKPSIFFTYLNSVGALNKLLPGFNLTKNNIKLIDRIADECSSEVRDMFIWNVVIHDEDLDSVLNNNYTVGQVRLPKEMYKFTKFIADYRDDFLKFHRKKPEEMVSTLTTINIKNHGSEDFIYTLNEYFWIFHQMDPSVQDLIIKVYDTFINTDLSELKDLIKDQNWSGEQIQEYVFQKRLVRVSAMF